MERIRPAAVLVNDLINLSHDADGLAQRNNDFLVMVNVILGQNTTGSRILASLSLAVLEPLVANLIAADIEVPYLLWDALETLCLCRVELYRVVRVGYFFDLKIAGADGGGDVNVELS